VYNTANMDALATAMIGLVSLVNSPRRDHILLREAGVELDRALFALLVMLDRTGATSVGDLADSVGRDSTTVSRQLARLEARGLVARTPSPSDRRVRFVGLTPGGDEVVARITAARRRLLSRALADWSATDVRLLAELTARLATALGGPGDDAPPLPGQRPA